jgi:hypothetical protein
VIAGSVPDTPPFPGGRVKFAPLCNRDLTTATNLSSKVPSDSKAHDPVPAAAWVITPSAGIHSKTGLDMFRTVARLAAGGLMVAALGTVFPAPALAQPSSSAAPKNPISVTITGDGLAGPLVITAEKDPDGFDAVYGEVSWLAGASGVNASPAAQLLGPKYTAVIAVNGVPKQTYDLYPMASGGSRAYRPSAQPDKRKTSSAWIYAHLTMASALRQAGVPVAGGAVNQPGGVGGGVVTSTKQAPADLDQIVGEWRRVVALNGALVILIAAGLFGISYLIRRKV